MQDEFKVEAGVSIECRNCGRRTTVPALKVEPGVKCEHCGKSLNPNLGDYAAKTAMLKVATLRDDVCVD